MAEFAASYAVASLVCMINPLVRRQRRGRVTSSKGMEEGDAASCPAPLRDLLSAPRLSAHVSLVLLPPRKTEREIKGFYRPACR